MNGWIYSYFFLHANSVFWRQQQMYQQLELTGTTSRGGGVSGGTAPKCFSNFIRWVAFMMKTNDNPVVLQAANPLDDRTAFQGEVKKNPNIFRAQSMPFGFITEISLLQVSKVCKLLAHFETFFSPQG